MIRNYTEEQLQQNYERFIAALKKVFTGERLEKLLHMYSEGELGIELTLAPASGKLHFHSAYVGGYMRVFEYVSIYAYERRLYMHARMYHNECMRAGTRDACRFGPFAYP